jgi:hypothetical protein
MTAAAINQSLAHESPAASAAGFYLSEIDTENAKAARELAAQLDQEICLRS